jgi:hypothetical protein
MARVQILFSDEEHGLLEELAGTFDPASHPEARVLRDELSEEDFAVVAEWVRGELERYLRGELVRRTTGLAYDLVKEADGTWRPLDQSEPAGFWSTPLGERYGAIVDRLPKDRYFEGDGAVTVVEYVHDRLRAAAEEALASRFNGA